MTLVKTLLLSFVLLTSVYAAKEEKKEAVTKIYDNINTASANGSSQAVALRNVFNKVNCPESRIQLLDVSGSAAICSDTESNLESKLWECVVIYSCVNN